LPNNFSQSLDLAPLFKDVARRLAQDTGLPSKENAALRRRLDSTASNLIFRQVEEPGAARIHETPSRWPEGLEKVIRQASHQRGDRKIAARPTAAGSEQIRSLGRR